MYLLDTDHITILQHTTGGRFEKLKSKLQSMPGRASVNVSIISIEEQMRGWLSVLAKEKKANRQIGSYRELSNLFAFYARFPRLLFDEDAVQRFNHLKAIKVRIGTMDLKIAAIALATQATLLTASRSDFEQVPGLRHENWLD